MDALTELRATVTRHAKAGTTSPDLPRLRCTISSRRTEPTTGTDDSWLGLIVQGAKRTVIGSRTFEFGAGDFLVASVSAPVTRQVTQAPCVLVGLRLQPSIVASLLLRDPGPRKRETPFAFATSKASDELLDAFRRYVRLLDTPEDIPVLGDAIEREILWRVVQSPRSAANIAVSSVFHRAKKPPGCEGTSVRWSQRRSRNDSGRRSSSYARTPR